VLLTICLVDCAVLGSVWKHTFCLLLSFIHFYPPSYFVFSFTLRIIGTSSFHHFLIALSSFLLFLPTHPLPTAVFQALTVSDFSAVLSFLVYRLKFPVSVVILSRFSVLSSFFVFFMIVYLFLFLFFPSECVLHIVLVLWVIRSQG